MKHHTRPKRSRNSTTRTLPNAARIAGCQSALELQYPTHFLWTGPPLHHLLPLTPLFSFSLLPFLTLTYHPPKRSIDPSHRQVLRFVVGLSFESRAVPLNPLDFSFGKFETDPFPHHPQTRKPLRWARQIFLPSSVTSSTRVQLHDSTITSPQDDYDLVLTFVSLHRVPFSTFPSYYVP